MPPGDAQRLFDALLGLDAPIGFAVLDSSHRYLAVNDGARPTSPQIRRRTISAAGSRSWPSTFPRVPGPGG